MILKPWHCSLYLHPHPLCRLSQSSISCPTCNTQSLACCNSLIVALCLVSPRATRVTRPSKSGMSSCNCSQSGMS